MTPREKAKELLSKFDLETGLMTVERKQCAIICCEELKEATRQEIDRPDFTGTAYNGFWDLVKEEIEKL